MEFNSKDCCVYYHLIEDKVVYVGMGSLFRAFDGRSRSTVWKNIMRYSHKYNFGYTVRIVKVFPFVRGKRPPRQAARAFELAEILRLKPVANIQDMAHLSVTNTYHRELLKRPRLV